MFFTIVFPLFSFHQLSLPWQFVFFVRYFVFVLLYCECYGFKRAFFTVTRFLRYMPSRHLAQPVFLKASTEAGSSSLKVAGPPTEVWNTGSVHPFFEFDIVQQNVLVIRYYLCVKVIRNTISTSSRSWNHFLPGIYVL